MTHRNEASQTSEQFKRFRKLAEQLINIPKHEVDAERAKYEEARRKRGSQNSPKESEKS